MPVKPGSRGQRRLLLSRLIAALTAYNIKEENSVFFSFSFLLKSLFIKALLTLRPGIKAPLILY